MPTNKLMTPEYEALLIQQMRSKPWGKGGARWAFEVQTKANELGLGKGRMLDYGCGQGNFKKCMALLDSKRYVDEYDPALPDKSKEPKWADFVVCTDVLEHVEEQFVVPTLDRLSSLSRRACFMVIAFNLSGTTLPDGRNAHVTVKPLEWWKERVEKAFADFDVAIYDNTGKQATFYAVRR